MGFVVVVVWGFCCCCLVLCFVLFSLHLQHRYRCIYHMAVLLKISCEVSSFPNGELVFLCSSGCSCIFRGSYKAFHQLQTII